MTTYIDPAADVERWADFRPRPGDVIISTPPKAGTTLTQLMVAMLLHGGPELPTRLVDLAPWFDQTIYTNDEAVAKVEALSSPRMLKTHTPLDAIPVFDGVVYVTMHRHPLDVFVSWVHHSFNINSKQLVEATKRAGYLDRLMAHRSMMPEGWDERFEMWRDQSWETSPFSLPRVARHATVAWERADSHHVTVLHFADAVADPLAALTELATALGVERSTEELDQLVPHTGIDTMRARSEEWAPNADGQLQSTDAFFRSGQGGEWRDLLSASALESYAATANELLTPEQRRWLERP